RDKPGHDVKMMPANPHVLLRREEPALTHRSPACRKLLQSAQHEGRTPLRMLDVVRPDIGEAAQQGGDGDLGLDAGELRAEAEMNAAAKRQRADLRTGDVEEV